MAGFNNFDIFQIARKAEREQFNPFVGVLLFSFYAVLLGLVWQTS